MTNGMPMELVVAIAGAIGTVVAAVLALIGVLLKTLLSGKGLGLTATQRLVDELQEERAGLLSRMDSMEARQRGWEADRERDHQLIRGLRRAYIELRRYVRAAGIVPPPVPAGLGVEDSHPHGLPLVVTTTTEVTQPRPPAEGGLDLDDDGADGPDQPAGAAA